MIFVDQFDTSLSARHNRSIDTMLVTEDDYFRTIKPSGKRGVKIKVYWYNAIRDFILSILDEDQISFSAFLQRVHAQFVNDLGDNTGWFLYHVKLDMEARGLIEHDRIKKVGGCQSFIRVLNKKRRKNFKEEQAMTSSNRIIMNRLLKRVSRKGKRRSD